MDSAGSTYETCVRLLLGQIASVVPVPREQDFGIDGYFQPRIAGEHQTETVAELGAVQIKGGDQVLKYGGFDPKGAWREFEFTWLRSLASPLYLARVDRGCSTVDLYSLWPLWLIFWRQALLPFEVVFATREPQDASTSWEEPRASLEESASGHGDGRQWTVDLGAPMLRLTQAELNDSSFRLRAIASLRMWLTYDRLTLMRFQQFIPVLDGITAWRTNHSEIVQIRRWQFWDSRAGANVARLCQTAAPVLVNLGIHLQHQNDRAAYSLIPALEWLNVRRALDVIGQGLLHGLKDAQVRGDGPGDDRP